MARKWSAENSINVYGVGGDYIFYPDSGNRMIAFPYFRHENYYVVGCYKTEINIRSKGIFTLEKIETECDKAVLWLYTTIEEFQDVPISNDFPDRGEIVKIEIRAGIIF